MQVKEVLNSKGDPIVLDDVEVNLVKYNQNICNALGYGDISISTLTAISKSIIEQKFFTIRPSDFVPVRIGQNPWVESILTYRELSLGGDFETGLINTAANMSRLAEASAGVEAVRVYTANWAKQITWSLPELRMAARAGNWDIVASKERARKRNWDLGIQKIAFLGSASDANIKGLLTQSDVTSNTSIITEPLSSMTVSELNTFLGALLQAYRANSNYTAWPTHFVIPESDYNGLANVMSETFPGVLKIESIRRMFATITQNPNFQILPVPYAMAANNASVGLNLNRYALYNYDEDSIRMDIPVDYTNTAQNSINGFQFQNVGYGQFSGVKAYRPREMLYFDYA